MGYENTEAFKNTFIMANRKGLVDAIRKSYIYLIKSARFSGHDESNLSSFLISHIEADIRLRNSDRERVRFGMNDYNILHRTGVNIDSLDNYRRIMGAYRSILEVDGIDAFLKALREPDESILVEPFEDRK